MDRDVSNFSYGMVFGICLTMAGLAMVYGSFLGVIVFGIFAFAAPISQAFYNNKMDRLKRLI